MFFSSQCGWDSSESITLEQNIEREHRFFEPMWLGLERERDFKAILNSFNESSLWEFRKTRVNLLLIEEEERLTVNPQSLRSEISLGERFKKPPSLAFITVLRSGLAPGEGRL